MLNWLQGKRTYIVVAATFIAGGLQACGVPLAPWIFPLLAAAGLGGLRAGLSSAAAAAKGETE